MKKLLASYLTFSLLAACARNLPPAATATPPVSWDELSMYESGLTDSARPILDELAGASVYRISLAINNDLVRVTGNETVRYTNREDVALDEIHFRLFPNILGGEMIVSNLQVDQTEVSSDLEMEDSLLVVQLSKPLPVGEGVVISMDFSVEVTTDVELNYGVQASYDGVLTLAHAYPMIAVYNENGWNAEIPPQSGDVAFADMSYFFVTITAADDVVIVASGMESAPETANRQQVMRVAAGPARDFFVAASRDYEVLSQTVGEVTINSYAPHADREGSRIALEVASSALAIFSDLFTPYPYTELDIVSTPTLALGVEYPGAIAIANRLYSDESYGGRTNALREGTVAHEVGHQWFYNLIGNDQLDEPWLDESLAQFATWEYYRVRYGADAAFDFESGLRSRWSRVDDAPVAVGQPVAAYSDSQYGAIVYGRGPLFFGALRAEMGEEYFATFLQDYAQEFSWGIATTDGLKALAEDHCSCDLSALFDEWIYP